MLQHNNVLEVVDLVCDEREMTKELLYEPIIKVCPCCEQWRKYYDFWYFVGKKKQESKICAMCYKELRQLDKYLARVLDGVKIPTYETPITKYPIESNVCSSSSQS